MRKFLLSCLLFTVMGGVSAWAQPTTPLKVDKKIPVTGNENFDFLLTRSVMIGNSDSARFESSRSGAYSFGIGYGVPMGKSVLLKFEPRVTWYKLYYTNRNEEKWFPSSDTSAAMIYEKIRISYLEVPVSLKFKLARNLIDRYKVLIEGGFVFGYQVGSTFKHRRWSGIDASGAGVGPKLTLKANAVDDVSKFRFGPFFRIGTNWISLYGFYRMSDVFRPYRKLSLPGGGSHDYPGFPRIEVGVTIAL